MDKKPPVIEDKKPPGPIIRNTINKEISAIKDARILASTNRNIIDEKLSVIRKKRLPRLINGDIADKRLAAIRGKRLLVLVNRDNIDKRYPTTSNKELLAIVNKKALILANALPVALDKRVLILDEEVTCTIKDKRPPGIADRRIRTPTNVVSAIANKKASIVEIKIAFIRAIFFVSVFKLFILFFSSVQLLNHLDLMNSTTSHCVGWQ